MCMECKMVKGLVPGQQTGFDAWAEQEVTRVEVGRGAGMFEGRSVGRFEGRSAERRVDGAVVEGAKRRRIAEVEVDPRLLGERELAVDTTGGQDPDDDYEARLRAALVDARDGNGDARLGLSTVPRGHTPYGQARGDAFQRQISPTTTNSDGLGLVRFEKTPAMERDTFNSGGALDTGKHVRTDSKGKAAEDWSWGGAQAFGGNEN